MELIFIIVCIALIVRNNRKSDAIHRENAGWVAETGNPVVQAQHGCNGCMGVLMWVGLGLAMFGIVVGGGG